MTNVQVGSLVLNGELLLYLAAGLLSVLAIYLLRRGNEHRERDLSVAWNAMLIWIAIWKGSLLVIDPVAVFRQPMSLLFFGGGTIGFWLACAVAVGYVYYRYSRWYGHSEAIIIVLNAVSGWTTVYLLSKLLFEADRMTLIQNIGLLTAVLVLVLLLGPWGMTEKLKRHPAWSGDKAAAGRLVAQSAGVLLLVILLGYTLHEQTRSGGLLRADGGGAVDGMAVGAREGNIAPDFELLDLEGNAVALEEYRGRTVMINFWTTWCKVCKTEMPHVEKLNEHYGGESGDVAILTVNVTSQELNAEHVSQYVAEQGFRFPVALDERGSVEEAYRIQAFPTTFVIDREGVIRERFLGAISFSDMKKRIERVRSRS